jgi:hypothetical protein
MHRPNGALPTAACASEPEPADSDNWGGSGVPAGGTGAVDAAPNDTTNEVPSARRYLKRSPLRFGACPGSTHSSRSFSSRYPDCSRKIRRPLARSSTGSSSRTTWVSRRPWLTPASRTRSSGPWSATASPEPLTSPTCPLQTSASSRMRGSRIPRTLTFGEATSSGSVARFISALGSTPFNSGDTPSRAARQFLAE